MTSTNRVGIAATSHIGTPTSVGPFLGESVRVRAKLLPLLRVNPTKCVAHLRAAETKLLADHGEDRLLPQLGADRAKGMPPSNLLRDLVCAQPVVTLPPVMPRPK